MCRKAKMKVWLTKEEDNCEEKVLTRAKRKTGKKEQRERA